MIEELSTDISSTGDRIYNIPIRNGWVADVYPLLAAIQASGLDVWAIDRHGFYDGQMVRAEKARRHFVAVLGDGELIKVEIDGKSHFISRIGSFTPPAIADREFDFGLLAIPRGAAINDIFEPNFIALTGRSFPKEPVKEQQVWIRHWKDDDGAFINIVAHADLCLFD